MVRRRSNQNRIEDSAPAWVLTFVPEDWPGDDVWPKYLTWKRAVHDHARHLRTTDMRAWLYVVSNTYGVRNRMWAAEGQERQRQSAANVQRTIELTTAAPSE